MKMMRYSSVVLSIMAGHVFGAAAGVEAVEPCGCCCWGRSSARVAVAQPSPQRSVATVIRSEGSMGSLCAPEGPIGTAGTGIMASKPAADQPVADTATGESATATPSTQSPLAEPPVPAVRVRKLAWLKGVSAESHSKDSCDLIHEQALSAGHGEASNGRYSASEVSGRQPPFVGSMASISSSGAAVEAGDAKTALTLYTDECLVRRHSHVPSPDSDNNGLGSKDDNFAFPVDQVGMVPDPIEPYASEVYLKIDRILKTCIGIVEKSGSTPAEFKAEYADFFRQQAINKAHAIKALSLEDKERFARVLMSRLEKQYPDLFTANDCRIACKSSRG